MWTQSWKGQSQEQSPQSTRQISLDALEVMDQFCVASNTENLGQV